VDVVFLPLPELGNRCHLVHDGRSALVVDPPRDLAAVERAADEAGVEISAVADTHVHNDYLSGALGLARRHGADYLLAADENVSFERVGVRDGDTVDVGTLLVHVIDTPGHTRHHQSFLVRDGSGPGALLSGGSLLDGTVGRTDLVDDRLTHHLARAQWASARALAGLAPDTRVLPTHGFGSFCASSTAAQEDHTTIADQATRNPALLQDQETFVAQLVAGFGPIPAHYSHMGELNRAGVGRRPPRPARPLSADQLADALAAGAWVVDLRSRRAHAAGHVPGTVGIEYSHQFATYVGWVVPWRSDLVLLTDALPDLAPALRDLAAIGIEGAMTHVLEPGTPQPATFRRTDWNGFGAAGPEAVVLDVRQRGEFEESHLPGAVHVPVQDVAGEVSRIPDCELWVHCRSGYRAGIAASLLHRSGRSVVHVDDDWDRLVELGIRTTTGLAA
jgi:hydroxyacylglutathione hydrolase